MAHIFTDRNGIYIIDLQKTVRKWRKHNLYVILLQKEKTYCLSTKSKLRNLSKMKLNAVVCFMLIKDGWAAC